MKNVLLLVLLGFATVACKNQSNKKQHAETSEVMSSVEKEPETQAVNSSEEAPKTDYKYVYASEEGDIIEVTYFNKNDEMFVKIVDAKAQNHELKQTNAWAKGAEYGAGNIKWIGKGNKATFIRDGVETKYLQAPEK